MKINQLVLYRSLMDDEILQKMTFLMENIDDLEFAPEDLQDILLNAASGILEIADKHGFYGNLWHIYITYLLANCENSYSKACEIKGEVDGSINQVVLGDFGAIMELFLLDIAELGNELNVPIMAVLADYEAISHTKKFFNPVVRTRICELATELEDVDTASDFKDTVSKFYGEYGVGKLGLHKAFRIAEHADGTADIQPITNITPVELDDLIGYESPKKRLIDNTEAFVNGKVANNCLLFGDAGTGKSTCIKAILNKYYDQGLRIIEVYKHQFKSLNDIIGQVKNRNYKFIIYMDDLSFEEFEIEYKYLKAVIEGGLEKKPENVLIYATSNRRHLVREEFADKEGRRDALHASDTVQEKLSLSARFGVSIYFDGPSKKEYQEIVKALAVKNGIDMPEEELLLKANKWEMVRGGRSGRIAQQFIDYLLGME